MPSWILDTTATQGSSCSAHGVGCKELGAWHACMPDLSQEWVSSQEIARGPGAHAVRISRPAGAGRGHAPWRGTASGIACRAADVSDAEPMTFLDRAFMFQLLCKKSDRSALVHASM
jgi:hypothetical protein